jgi:glycosyltransferase involved in cell wall biosynthesis
MYQMNIGFVLSTRGHVTGGLETIADELASGLAARGHRVTMLAGFRSRAVRRNDLPADIDVLWHRVIPWQSALLRSLGRLAATSPLNLQSTTLFLAALANGSSRRRLAGFDVTVSFLEGEAVLFSRYQARRGRASVYYCAGGFDHRWAARDRSTVRVAISQTIADDLKRLGYRCDGVVTPGIASELLERPLRGQPDSDGFRVVFIGRLSPEKGVARLLRVVAALLPVFPRLTLHIVGDGPDRPILEAAVTEHHLENSVRLIGDLSKRDVYDELSHADLLLFPSSYESFGIVALEAMAAGVPVVASDLPALRMTTGGFACLLPPDDERRWIETVDTLLRDSGRREQMARRGRLWASRSRWDDIVPRFEAHLQCAVETVRTDRNAISAADPNQW